MTGCMPGQKTKLVREVVIMMYNKSQVDCDIDMMLC